MDTNEAFPWLTIFFGMFVRNIPMLLVSLIGVILVLVRREHMRGAVPWASAGFGIIFLLGIVGPGFYTFMQARLMDGGDRMAFATMSTVVSFGTGLMQALSLVCLLVAILAGRNPAVAPPAFPGTASG